MLNDVEASQLRYHSPVLQRAVDGLFDAQASWRTVAVLLARLPDRWWQAQMVADDGGADWGGHPYLEPDWSSATRKGFMFPRLPLRR